MKFKMIISIVLIIIISGIAVAKAQDTGGIAPGSKIRISSGGKMFEGTVSSFGDKKITLLSMDGSGEKTFSIEDISRIKRYAGIGSHWKRGALIGAGAGLTWGLIRHFTQNDAVDDYLCGTGCRILATGLSVTAGSAAGGLIGLLFKAERWEEVPFGKGFDVGLLPAADGGYVTLSFSF